MEQLIAEIEIYAAQRGIKPATVLQLAAGFSGTTWEKWISKSASCSFRSAERIRDYIKQNPHLSQDMVEDSVAEKGQAA